MGTLKRNRQTDGHNDYYIFTFANVFLYITLLKASVFTTVKIQVWGQEVIDVRLDNRLT